MPSQMSRVEQELNELRQKHLAKNQRDKLKNAASPLTTPEEAQQFLRTMRKAQKEGTGISHKPPSNLSADGMDAWYLQQKQRELELRKRRQEAEALLRGYRMSAMPRGSLKTFGSPMSAVSESLDDPDCHSVYSNTPRRHTIHAGDMPQHLLPPGSSKRGLVSEFDNESTADCDLKTPTRDGSFSQGAVLSAKDKIEEKKTEHDPVHYKGRHSLPGRHMTETPHPMEEKDNNKAFLPETIWRDFISNEPGAKFQPESGRYHLYASYACPGSHRALIVRALKGLQGVISVTIVHPTWRHTNLDDPNDKHRGWIFGDPNGEPFSNTIGRGGPFPPAYADNEPDPIFNAYSIRNIYENACDTSGKYTIPLIWDKKLNTIVNNESSDIAYMLNSCFNDFATNPDLDLYTEDDEEGMEKLNEVSEWLYPLMIHGVYRCGFAKSQSAYDQAIAELTEAFDKADLILQRQRYLTGDALTDADIRLFVTLLRYDEVYAFYFKANTRLVMLTPSLLNFCREIFQLPGVSETCNIEHIKAHFFGSHAEWNKYSVIPRGLGFIELLDMPHDRDQFQDTEDLPLDFDTYEKEEEDIHGHPEMYGHTEHYEDQ